MAVEFNAVSFLGRWAFAAALVFGTYNPTAFSYISWLLAEGTEFGPVPALLGVILLICWIMFIRATWISLGPVGIILGLALFGCMVWLMVDLGILSLDSTSALTWIALLLMSLLLATGMSWSHIRRRLSGQFDVDEVDEV
ncbi:MAG: DUF6524 family protein [Pseudomonadota bacterium]